MDRDHWAFGAGYEPQKQRSLLAFSQPAKTCPPSLTLFFFPLYFFRFIRMRATQSPHLSGHPRRRAGAVARDLAAALGV